MKKFQPRNCLKNFYIVSYNKKSAGFFVLFLLASFYTTKIFVDIFSFLYSLKICMLPSHFLNRRQLASFTLALCIPLPQIYNCATQLSDVFNRK